MQSYAKALLACAIAAISFAIPCANDGLTFPEYLGTVLAGLTALGVVYRVPNAD